MARQLLCIRIRVAWWLKPWLYCLAFVSTCTQREPDWVKVGRVIDRALCFDLVRCDLPLSTDAAQHAYDADLP